MGREVRGCGGAARSVASSSKAAPCCNALLPSIRGGGGQGSTGRESKTALPPASQDQHASTAASEWRAHLGLEREVRQIVCANHEPDACGSQAARPLPVLQPPQQVRVLVTADGGDERPGGRALLPGRRIVAVFVRRVKAHAGATARLENTVSVEDQGQSALRRAGGCRCAGFDTTAAGAALIEPPRPPPAPLWLLTPAAAAAATSSASRSWASSQPGSADRLAGRSSCSRCASASDSTCGRAQGRWSSCGGGAQGYRQTAAVGLPHARPHHGGSNLV